MLPFRSSTFTTFFGLCALAFTTSLAGCGSSASDPFATARAALEPDIGEPDIELPAADFAEPDLSELPLPPGAVPALQDLDDPGPAPHELRPRTGRLPLPEDAVAELESRRETFIAEARAHAEGLLAQPGFTPDDGLELERARFDPFGRFHARFQQTHLGIPVLGGGLAVHLADGDLPLEFSDGLVRDVRVDPTPDLEPGSADAAALADYDPTGVAKVHPTSRLAILADWKLVPAGRVPSTLPNRDEFERQNLGNRLVYEIQVAPEYPARDAGALAGALGAATPDPTARGDEDAAVDELTVGGNEPPVVAEQPGFFEEPTEEPMVFLVDANSGEIVERRSLLVHNDLLGFTPAKGEGKGFYVGEVELDTAEANGIYVLMDMTRAGDCQFVPGNIVFDALHAKSHDTNDYTLMADGNNVWGDGSIMNSEGSCCSRRQTPAVDVAHVMARTFDLLDYVLGRDGIDGFHGPQFAAVHWSDEYGDAHFNGASGLICFGDGKDAETPGGYNPIIIGHELGHALWSAENLGTSTREARALNEGHGDIMGSMVNFFETGARGVGEIVFRVPQDADWYWRLRNPEAYSEPDWSLCELDPDDYEDEPTPPECLATGFRYWSPLIAESKEHVGGLPFGRAIMHLAEGSSDDPASQRYSAFVPDGMAGIGMTKAAKVWYHAIAYYVHGTPDYQNVRAGCIAAAKQLFGSATMEVRATMNAFAAIGVGQRALEFRGPEVHQAVVWDVDTVSMTARVFVHADDDNGIRECRILGHGNTGALRGEWLHGYVDLNDVPPGKQSVQLEVHDADGRTASVSRTFTMPHNRQLLANGGFETTGSWNTLSGDDPVRSNNEWSFAGSGYLVTIGSDEVSQSVVIPGDATKVTLAYRLLTRDSARVNERFRVQVRDPFDNVLEEVAVHTGTSTKSARNFVNRGWIPFEHDLSAHAGELVKLTFVAESSGNRIPFFLDQVALTYEPDVFIGKPKVNVLEEDDTVAFQLYTVTGLDPSEILRVDYQIDDKVYFGSTDESTQYYSARQLSRLSPGGHAVRAVVRGLDQEVLGVSEWVLFRPSAVLELVDNGGFENGTSDWPHRQGNPESIRILQGGEGFHPEYWGHRCLDLGAKDSPGTTSVAQTVNVPAFPWTLKLVSRVDVLKVSSGGGIGGLATPTAPDTLHLDLIDRHGNVLDSFELASSDDSEPQVGFQHTWNGYRRTARSLDATKYSGKQILLRLRATNHDDKITRFRVDEVSLSYTTLPEAGQ